MVVKSKQKKYQQFLGFVLLFVIIIFIGIYNSINVSKAANEIDEINYEYETEVEYVTPFGSLPKKNVSLPSYIKFWFNALIIAGISLAAIVIAFGGLYYLFCWWTGRFKNEAKEWIKSGILGLLLLLSTYLILYTINPALITLKLEELSPIELLETPYDFLPTSRLSRTFQEIPAGTLTEILLTRKISCYEFDEWGNPIDGKGFQADPTPEEEERGQPGKFYHVGPTFLELDRVECGLDIGKGIEKKAQIANKLAEKIAEIIKNECKDCSACKGSSDCPQEGGSCWGVRKCQSTGEEICSEEVIKKIKEGPIIINCEDLNETSNNKSVIKNNSLATSKDKFANFQIFKKKSDDILNSYFLFKNNSTEPIRLTIASSSSKPQDDEFICQIITLKGLKEYQSEFNYDYEKIKEQVELIEKNEKGEKISIKKNGKPLWLINNGRCMLCNYNCPFCSFQCNEKDNVCQQKKIQCENQKRECINNYKNCVKKYKECLQKNSPWYKLRLIDQLIYLNGKLKELSTQVKKDLNNLEIAETLLQKCYLVDTAVDFLKIYETTNKKETKITIRRTFNDPFTGKKIDPSRYCKGFQYQNTYCFHLCNKVCPLTTNEVINCYKQAPYCPLTKKEGSQKRDPKCLSEQKKYIEENCLKERVCVYATNLNTFSKCMDLCKEKCFSDCEKKFLDSCCKNENESIEGEKEKCFLKCENDSKCILENDNSCIINFQELVNCVNPKSCEERCEKNPLCVETCRKERNDYEYMRTCIERIASLCPYCSNQYAGYPECVYQIYYQENKYSSSFIYKNPESEVCPNPLGQENKKVACESFYPETTKCPSFSKCPSCPCAIIEKEEKKSENNSESSENKEYRICSIECQEYGFNDDPLTFYCNTKWWEKEEGGKPVPRGSEEVCAVKTEIPVGQTLDEAEKWGSNFLKNLESLLKKTDELSLYLRKIGETDIKKECRCEHECGCKEKCIPIPCEQKGSTCCQYISCQPHPCQKILNMLLGTKEKEKKETKKECIYPGVKEYFNQIEKLVKELKKLLLEEYRSEVLKKLDYSRKMINNCAVNYPKGSRLLKCMRVEHEIMPPLIATTRPHFTIINGEKVESYCYGQELGIIKGNPSMADNWFCCNPQGIIKGIVK